MKKEEFTGGRRPGPSHSILVKLTNSLRAYYAPGSMDTQRQAHPLKRRGQKGKKPWHLGQEEGVLGGGRSRKREEERKGRGQEKEGEEKNSACNHSKFLKDARKLAHC